MNAVIYVCHGSRVLSGREQAIHFINKVMNNNLAPIQEYCFLELAAPTIEEAFVSSINKGASKIVVVPILLLTAAHAKKDIPDELARLKGRFPEVEVICSEPIGAHPKMAGLLIERLNETGESFTDNSMVLLVGRGSSDPDVKRDLGQVAEMLRRSVKILDVETCFLTAASPSLEEGLQAAIESGYEKIFVIPYLLFTGMLMKRINRVIDSDPKREKIHLCNYLGYHSSIEDILTEKVSTLLKAADNNIEEKSKRM